MPVTLTIRRFERQLILSQTGVSLEMEQGAPPVTNYFFRVGDEGATGSTGAGINWTARAATTSGGTWLRTTSASGNTSDDSSYGEGADIDVAGLAAGVYYGFIEVSAADAGNSPQRATVTLNVRPPGAVVSPVVNPGGAVLIASQGANTEILPIFQITNRSASTLTFTTTVDTEDGGGWLTAGPTTPIAPGATVNYHPSAKTQGLARGVYRGTVSATFSNQSTALMRVGLVITPPQSSALTAGGPAQVGCTPNQTVPVLTRVGNGGPATSSQAQAITVQVVDDCGNAMTRGSVAATFNGPTETYVPMQNIDGEWSGTWTPDATSDTAAVNLSVTATAEDGVTGTTGETVPLEPNPNPPPAFTTRGVVNAASFDAEPLAPGTILSIFGSGLSAASVASGGMAPAKLPLPTELGGTQVTIADKPLPLLFVREDQVNAILPFELGDRSTEKLPVVVRRTDSDALSTAQPVAISAARPGVFTQTGSGDGPASVLDINFRLVDADNPVRPGDAVQVYATGLGLTDRPVATEQGAPADPLASAAEKVRVTVGGLDAAVLFAGLSPGYAGLYQVNLVIPQGVAPGNAELVIYAAGQPSRTATIAIRPTL